MVFDQQMEEFLGHLQDAEIIEEEEKEEEKF